MNETDNGINLSPRQSAEVAILLTRERRLKYAIASMIATCPIAITLGALGLELPGYGFLLIGVGMAFSSFWYFYMFFVTCCPRCGRWPCWNRTLDQCANCGLRIAVTAE